MFPNFELVIISKKFFACRTFKPLKRFKPLNNPCMSDLLTISLNNVRFRAYHGLHPEERQKGNDFVVNMEVSYMPGAAVIHSLEDTIDYAVLFEIINNTMQKPVDLLETLAQTIADNSYKQFRQIKEISVSVEKLNPPIDKFSGTVKVTYSKKY